MKHRQLLPLFLTMLLDNASYVIRFPVLTLVFFDNATRLFPLGTSTVSRSFWYGVCMGIYWIGSIIAAPILSIASDYRGRRNVLLLGSFGTLFFALFTVLGVLWGNLGFILLGALIGGLCSRMDPIAQAVVGDVCKSGKDKITYMSYLQIFLSVGAFLGPFAGFLAHGPWFSKLNFSLPFIVAMLLAGLGAGIILFYFRETAPPVSSHSHREKFFNFKAVIINKQVLLISLLLILIQWSWSTYYQFIAPITKKTFHFTAGEISVFMSLIALWLSFASAFGVPFLQRFLSIAQIIRYSVLMIFLGLLGSFIVTYFPQMHQGHFIIWLLAIPVAAGDVISYCAITTLYSDAVDKTAQGQVMGTNFIIISAVWASTSFIGGLLLGAGNSLPLAFSLVGVFILLLLFLNKNIYKAFQKNLF